MPAARTGRRLSVNASCKYNEMILRPKKNAVFKVSAEKAES
jgi:hypothetical protein